MATKPTEKKSTGPPKKLQPKPANKDVSKEGSTSRENTETVEVQETEETQEKEPEKTTDPSLPEETAKEKYA